MKKLFIIVLLCFFYVPTSVLATDGNGNICPEGSPPDCLGVCSGDAVFDSCGVCNGNDQDIDDCGVCFGNNNDKDSCGVCFGNNEAVDQCGICFGNGGAVGCDGACFSETQVECGICAPSGEGCEQLCADIVPPPYYRDGITVGCIPSGCTSITFGYEGWSLIAEGCPDGQRYAIAPGTLIPGTLCGCIRNEQMGCFTPDAKIMTPDGERRIDNLRAGDLVLNPVTGKQTAILKVVQSPEKKPLISFGYGDVRVKVTQTHPVYTRDGVKKAKDLKKGDVILASDGSYQKVTILEYLEPRYGQQVFNLILDTPLSRMEAGSMPVSYNGRIESVKIIDNLLLSDGIVTGDMAVQILINQE